MKKLIALLMAILMATAMLSTAMADGETGNTTTSGYTPICPENFETTYTHTLQLTGGLTKIEAYVIDYTFEVSEKATIMQPSGIVNPSLAVEGAPSIRPIQYGPATSFSSGSVPSATTNLDIDWSKVLIKEPGVYRWTVTKKWSDTDETQNATNEKSTFYLYVYATDKDGTLAGTMGLTVNPDLDSTEEEIEISGHKSNLEDQYPSSQVKLSITKNVKGTQASRNKYFKYTIQLTPPAGSGSKEYTVQGVDTTIPQSAYNSNEFTYVNKVTLTAGETAEIDVWLKHGQTAVIEGMPYGTLYNITEATDGYFASIVVAGDSEQTISGDAEDEKKGKFNVSDTLVSDQRVTYTNEKNATVPTGIDLQTSAPIFGLLMAMAMMFMAFAGKRKEQMN